MNHLLRILLKHWDRLGNTYGTEEGGWTHLGLAESMRYELIAHGYSPDELFILGRMGGDGWEVAAKNAKYDHFCITDNSGEYILQPGEDDGELTEQGVCRMAPPKGWFWNFVA